MRPSCGTRFSEMSSLEITLMREASLSLIASGGCATSLSMPSSAVADAVILLVRLEVDVRRAGGDRVDQHLLDVADDRRVLDLAVLVGARRLDRAFLERDLDVLEGRPSPSASCRSPRSAWRSPPPSLSSSTTTGSTTRLVLKRTSSSACRLAGSDVATYSRLPRLCSGRTRRVCGNLGCRQYSLLIWSTSKPARSSSGTPNAREAKTASCCARHPLARQHLLDEWDARRLGLHLERLRLGFGHEAVLGQRAGEAADVAGGGVGGHGVRWSIGSGVESTQATRVKAVRSIFHSHKISLSMMPARPVFVKARHRGPPGQQLDDFHRAVLGLQDLDRLPARRKLTPGLRDVAQMLDDQAVERLRAVQRKLCAQPAVQRAQRRHSVDDDAAVGLAAEDFRPPGACVVNSPMISSTMSSIVTRPCNSPYSSTTSPRRWRSVWNCCSWVSSGVPAGMK